MSEFDSNVYNMSEALHNIAQAFVPEEDDETMALGLYGFLNAVHSTELSNSIRIAQENANEVFFSRARLTKNIIAHAFMNGIEDIYATPSYMPILIWLNKSDVDSLITEHGGLEMTLDRNIPIIIGDYEFHLDYDIKISKRSIVDKDIYVARYDMTYKNPISDIENVYLDAPYIVKRTRAEYICIRTSVRQCKIKVENKTLMTDNIIENKSHIFTFKDQLVGFDVFVTEGTEVTRLTPIFQGQDIGDIERYCNYTYIDANTIRIAFDSESYMPKINAKIKIIITTTSGSQGNYFYTEEVGMIIQDTDDYTYMNSTMFIDAQGKAEGGADAKTMKELQRLLPQNALSRKNLINNKDLNNFFNKYNTEASRINFVPSVHNQFNRIYYGYLLQKDAANNVVPTNTVNFDIDISSIITPANPDVPDTDNIKKTYIKSNNNAIDYVMYTFNPNCCVGLIKTVNMDKDGNPILVPVDRIIPDTFDENGNPVTERIMEYSYITKTEFISNNGNNLLTTRPDLVNTALIMYYDIDHTEPSEEKEALKKLTVSQFYEQYGFLYTFPYKTILNSEGPTLSFFETVMDEVYRIDYERGNIQSPLEMILTYGTWRRTYRDEGDKPTSDRYTLLINVTQNITENFNLLIPMESDNLFAPLYTMMEQHQVAVVNEFGVPTGETSTVTVSYYYRDITELIIHCNLSDGDVVLGSEVGGSGALLYNNMEFPTGVDRPKYYYTTAYTLQGATTIKHTDQASARETYESYNIDDDTEYVYKKWTDDKGQLHQVQNQIDDEEFSNHKIYVETHYNGITKADVSEEYESLIDALYTSAESYAVEVPTSRYIITEYDIADTDKQNGNILYDSEVDRNNDDLVFLQIKNNERIINVRCNLKSISDKIDLIPKDMNQIEDEDDKIVEQPAYEYMVFDKYGAINEAHNTYTENWEGYDEYTSQGASIESTFDEYSDLDYDTDGLYKDEMTDKRFYVQLKILTCNPITGMADTAKYVNTLQAAVTYMAQQTNTCLLYYTNIREDISSKIFSMYDEDFIYKCNGGSAKNYDLLVVTNEVLKNQNGFNRYKIISMPFDNEDNIDIDTIMADLGTSYSRYNVYTISSDTDNILICNYGRSTTYSDSGITEDEYRTYKVGYTVDGVYLETESYDTIAEVLEYFKDGTFRMNKIYRVEKGVLSTIMYSGTGDKEIYFIEYFDNNEQSNLYAVNSRSKLAIVYTKVANTIQKLIDSGSFNNSDQLDDFLKVYDIYGNEINIDESYEGTVYNTSIKNKLYPIYTSVGIRTTDENGEIERYIDIIDAIKAGAGKEYTFDILDYNEEILYPAFNVEEHPEIYVYTEKSDLGNYFMIFDTEEDYKSSCAYFQNRNTNHPITISYKLTYDADSENYDVEVLNAKDESSNKYNTYIDRSTITEDANIGVAIPVVSGDDEEEKGAKLNTTTLNTMSIGKEVDTINLSSDESVSTLEDLAQVMDANPDVTINSITSGDQTISYSGVSTGTEEETIPEEVIPSTDGSSTSDISYKIDGKKCVVRTTAILVLYDEEDKPICYFKAEMMEYDEKSMAYVFRFELGTDDTMDRNNRINIKPEADPKSSDSYCYYPGTSDKVDRYLNNNVSARIYLLSKFADVDGSNLQTYGELGLNNIVDYEGLGLTGYTTTNVYNIYGGLQLYENFSDIVHSNVSVGINGTTQTYHIKGVPMIRKMYADNNDKITEFIQNLKTRKNHIEESQEVLENNYDVDVKFYNTYGPANIYYTKDIDNGSTLLLDRTNLTINYGIKLKKSSDDYTIEYIKKDIKDAIENLDEVNEMYLDNLAAELYMTYQNSVYYIEFRGINNYDSTRRSLFVEPSLKQECIPEFININLIMNESGNFTPDINVVSI